jgi:hypothetical protein
MIEMRNLGSNAPFTGGVYGLAFGYGCVLFCMPEPLDDGA